MDLLIKFSLKETARFLVPLMLFDIVFIISYILVIPQLMLPDWAHSLGVWIPLLVLTSNFVLLTAVLLVHYYKSLYGSMAHWTHTLPVTTADKLNSQIFIYIFWNIWFSVITIINFFILLDYVDRTPSLKLEKSTIEMMRHFIAQLNLNFTSLMAIIVGIVIFFLIALWCNAIFEYFTVSVAARFCSIKTVVFGVVFVGLFQAAFSVFLQAISFYFWPYFLTFDVKKGQLVYDIVHSNDPIVFTAQAKMAAPLPILYFLILLILSIIFYMITRLLISRRKDLGH